MPDRSSPRGFDDGAVARKPAEIMADPMLSNAHKIELLKSFKAHYAAPKHAGVLRAADLELEKLLTLNSLANDGR